MLLKSKKMFLNCLNGRFAGEYCVVRPERMQAIPSDGICCIPRGFGGCFSDAALNDNGHVVLMERLNRILSFDPSRGVLRAEAGISLNEILSVIIPYGWFLPVTPTTKFASLGGCVACDIHGRNHYAEGSFSDYIEDLVIQQSDGQSILCSPSLHPDFFWATVGGMGLTGFISEVSIKLKPIESTYLLVRNYSTKNLDETLDILEDADKEDVYASLWIDCFAKNKDFGRGILKCAHHTSLLPITAINRYRQPKQHTRRLPLYFLQKAVNTYTIRLFNHYYYYKHQRKNDPFLMEYENYFYSLNSFNSWNHTYNKKGFITYQIALPKKNGRNALRTILKKISQEQHKPFFATIQRLGKTSQSFLTFQIEGYSLSLDFPLTNSLFSFLNELDHIVIEHSGRVCLPKDFRLNPDAFKMMYPNFSQWLTIKRQIDPDWAFSSILSKRLHMKGDNTNESTC